MKLRILKHLRKSDSLEGDAEAQDLSPALEAVEQSRLALEKAEENSRAADRIAAHAARIEQRNGFGQLLDKLTEPRAPRESGRNLNHGHGHSA